MSNIPSPLQANCLTAIPHVVHGFFTREGGVSENIYASLNCGPGSRDVVAHINENRRRVADRLELAHDGLSTLYQVHSAEVLVMTKAADAEDRPHADAQVSQTPNIGLGILTADCAPILFAAQSTPVIGAAHAGWRGACSGVIEETLRKMETLGTPRDDIVAAVGPCISQDVYEIGPDMYDAVLQQDAEAAYFFKSGQGDRRYFDLPGYVANRLKSAGIGLVDVLAQCTYASDEKFFSYRRATHKNESDYGRQISVISLRAHS